MVYFVLAKGTSSLPNRYNKMGGKALDLDTPSAVSNADSHTPKSYKKKDRRLPTKRFNTVGKKEDLDDADDDDDDDDDDDGLNGGGDLDGELDMKRFEREPSEECSLSKSSVNKAKNEAIYDLAEQTEEKTRVTSPNSNNNNGSDTSSLANADNSLYDLVGKINAGEDESDIKEQEVYEVIKQESIEQDVYEPIISQPSSPVHVKTPTNVAMSLPNSNAFPEHNKLSKASSLGLLPPIPHEPSLDLYEAMENPEEHQQVLYEEIIGNTNDIIIDSGSDTEDDDCVPLPPPIPKPRRLTNEENILYDNAPVLPIKVLSRSTSPLPPMEQDDDSYYGNAPSLPQKPISNKISPPSEIRNIKSPIPTPRKISKVGRQEEDSDSESLENQDIYDDTILIANQNNNLLPKQLGNQQDNNCTLAMENESGNTQ